MTPIIGLQLYTVRDAMAEDLPGTLKEVARMGYTHVQLSALPPVEEPKVIEAVRAANLTVSGLHEPAPRITSGAAADFARDLDCPVIAYPWLDESDRTPTGYAAAADVLKAAKAAAPDLHWAYHNHDFEFAALTDAGFEGKTGMDVLFADPSIDSELDVCWVAIAGHDPVAWMNKLKNRLPLIHLKDSSNYADCTFCEIGSGNVDLGAVLAAAESCGVQSMMIEQDRGWIDGDCMKSAAVSLAALKKLMGK